MPNLKNRRALAAVARRQEKADLVFKNGAVVNVFTQECLVNDVAVKDGYIAAIGNDYHGGEEIDCSGMFISPGFIDTHVHIESQMTMPANFVRAVLPTGTTTIVTDPHEIVNVAGADGMRFILEASENVPCNYFVTLPSCVPASKFETCAARFDADAMKSFLDHPRVIGLGEMMSYTEAINGDSEVLRKIEVMDGRHIDGHAPRLVGDDLQAYLAATDARTEHETTLYEEMVDKVRAGVAILIRENTISPNLRVLVNGLIKSGFPNDRFAFCSDDRDLEDIWRRGHIVLNVRLATKLGMPATMAVRLATWNAARIYNLRDVGAIAPGYKADIVLLKNLTDFEIYSVYKDGVHSNRILSTAYNYEVTNPRLLGSVKLPEITPEKIALKVIKAETEVIGLISGQLTTRRLIETVPVDENGYFKPNTIYSKAVVVERHGINGNIAVAPLRGYGIASGALATTFSHDSHNLVVVGSSDDAILMAINRVRELNGGLVLADSKKVICEVQLPICGMISTERAYRLGQQISELVSKAHEMGVPLPINPYLLPAFLPLTVIPELRLTDRGIFDVVAHKLLTPEK